MALEIIGRDAQLAAIDEFLRKLESGPAALVIAGEAGIGKSTLWRAAVDRAVARGWRVLETRPLEADASIAFAGIGDLLGAIDDQRIMSLPGPQAFALQVACRRAAPGPRGVDRVSVFAGFVALLKALAAEGPTLVAIDDIQWLDRSSLRVIEHAARRVRGRIGFVIAVRPRPDGSTPLALDASLDPHHVDHLELGALSVAALHHILKERLHRTYPLRLLRRIEQASAGNPFFALEIAKVLPDRVAASGPLPVPASIGGLVTARIRGLPAQSREALLAAALLAAPSRSLVLAATSGRPVDSSRALDTAEHAGLITVGSSVRFVHPIVAAAVQSSASGPARRAMHLRLASVVTDLEQRARHLAMGTPGPDEAIAGVLSAAADHAGARGAPDEAAELADMARGLTPDDLPAERYRRTIQAAEYWFHAGETRRAREALEAVTANGVAGVLRADALRLLGDVRLHQDSLPEAMAMYETAIKFVSGDAARMARIETASAFAAVTQGDFSRAREHADRGLAAAQRNGQPAAVAETIAVAAIANFLMGRGLNEDAIERALASEDYQRSVPIEMRPSLIVGLIYLYVGRLDDARRLLEALRARVIDRGDEAGLHYVSGNLAWLEVCAGRVGAAERFAAEALVSTRETGTRSAEASALAFVSLAAAWKGDRDGASVAMAATEEAAADTGNVIATLWSRWGGAILALALNDPAAAYAALSPLMAMIPDEAYEPARVPFVADAVEALVELGELERGERLLVVLEGNADRLDRTWAQLAAARARIHLLTARGELDEARRVATSAFEHPAIEQFPFERGRILMAHARTCRRGRRRREAAIALGIAEDLFAAGGALAWAAKARSEVQRLGLERTNDVLTPSEERIASLAAAGRTNREVADQLFISPKTVEVNLSRAYAKLSISSRAELGAVMLRRRQQMLEGHPRSGDP